MQTSTYVLNADGTYSPVNIIATGGIRCIECSQLCPPDGVEPHMHTHVHSRYVQNASSLSQARSRTQPLQLAALVEQEEADDISVKSVDKQQLPSQDVHRKKIYRYHEDGERMQSFRIQPLQMTIPAQDNFCDDEQLQTGIDYPDSADSLEMARKVIIPYSTHAVPRKKISMMQQSFNQYGHEDTQHQLAKQKSEKDLESVTSGGFEVVKLRSPPKEPIQQSRVSNVQIVDVGPSKKKQKKGFKVSTVSSPKAMTETKVNSGKKSTGNEFQCPSCHGFYCQTCKSTIPPYYRPPRLTKKGDDTTSTDFYKASSYDCDACKQ